MEVCGRDVGTAGNGVPALQQGQRVVLGVWRHHEDKEEDCKKCPDEIS